MISKRVVDIDRLNELEDLRSDDGNDFVSSLIIKFLELLPTRLEAINKFSEEKNLGLLRREIHSFKLSCEILGANALADCLKRLDADSRQSNIPQLRRTVCEAETVAANASQELYELLYLRSKKNQATVD